MLVAAYFAFPYLNEEKYQEIVEEYKIAEPVSGYEEAGILSDDEEDLVVKGEIEKLQATIDSLKTLNEQLKQEFEDSLKAIQEMQPENIEQATVEAETISDEITDENTSVAGEDFTERVKSLLNLDEESLSPILNKMTNEQLVRLYGGAGGIQREKLLRSLDPERAAKLMTEVML